MKILVTGGAGFIASHVVDAYVAEKHDVIVVDNLSTGYRKNLNSKAKFYLCDITSNEFKSIIDAEKPDIINHHAAQISVPNSVADPLFDLEINGKGFLNLLNASVHSSVKKVIFISSGGAVYGEAEEYPTSENYIPQPLSPYAIHKYLGEKYLYYFNKQYGLNYTVLRYSNVFGPRQVSHGEAGVVSIFIEKLLNDKDITLYAFPECPAGMIRDYVYIKDVVSANLLALSKGDNNYINISTNKETNTKTLYDEVCSALGVQKEYTVENARPGDIRRSCIQNEKAKRILGWEPKYTLSTAVKETVAYFLSLQSE